VPAGIERLLKLTYLTVEDNPLEEAFRELLCATFSSRVLDISPR
jgi:hypothetical protein